jgi:hypothetical protein
MTSSRRSFNAKFTSCKQPNDRMCAAIIQSMMVEYKGFWSHQHAAIHALGSIVALKEAVKAWSDAGCLNVVLLDISTIPRLSEHRDRLGGDFDKGHDADSSRSQIAACVVMSSRRLGEYRDCGCAEPSTDL